MGYDWNYLCSDPRRLAITLRFLPDGLPGLSTMNVCYASHLDGDLAWGPLARTLEQYAPSWLHWTLRDLSHLKTHVPDQLRGYWANDKKRWALGMKLVMPYVTEDPYLYTDDDVLLLEDPRRLMANSFGTAGNFKFFKGNRRLFPLALELFSAFYNSPRENWSVEFQHPSIAADLYDRQILDAGIWFQKDPYDWSQRLYQFAKLPYLTGLDPTSHEFRRIDQRFLTLFGIKHGWDQLHVARDRRNCYSHPTKFRIPTLVKGTTFVHYKTGRHKADWMTALERYLETR